MALFELLRHSSRSTAAVLGANDLFAKTSVSALDSSWNQTYGNYISTYIRLCNTYNDMVQVAEDRPQPRQICNMLQRAVIRAKPLQDVHVQELENVARGGRPWTLEEYTLLLKDAAAHMDTARQVSSRRTRSSNEHLWGASDDDHNLPDEQNDDHVFEAMVSQQNLASTMNKQTWGALSQDTKKAWDTIPPPYKAKILACAEDRAQRRGPAMQANIADAQAAADEPSADLIDKPVSDATESPSMEANAAKSIQEANATKGSVHPGDVHRMMSKKPSGNARRAGNTVRWEVNTAQQRPPEPPPSPESTPISDPTTDSDAWGGDTVSTSSQSSPPSTFSNSTDSRAPSATTPP